MLREQVVARVRQYEGGLSVCYPAHMTPATRYRCLPLILAVFLISSLSWPLPVGAEIQHCAPVRPPQTTQPPPLFPKHRRGIYTNDQNIDLIDATPQSPPLEIDDPSVPDKGEFEINLLTLADSTQDARNIDVLRVDANYGLVLCRRGYELPTQLKIEFPLSAAREGSAPYRFGLGTVAIGMKFNFYNDDNRGLRVSVYPQGEFSLDSSVEKGVAEGGQTLVLPLLAAREFKYVTAVMNAGIERSFHAPNHGNTTDLGLGLGRGLFRKLAIMGDVRSSSTSDFKERRLVSANIGAMYGVRNAILYIRTGHSLFSDNGAHAFFALGTKVLIDTANKP
jgi:hypothetical protein